MVHDAGLARQALDIHYELKLHLLNNLDAFAGQFDMTPKQKDEFERYVKGPVKICASHARNMHERLTQPPGEHHGPNRQ